MPLSEEFVSTGRWLFRWRSYLPIVLILVCLVALYERRDSAVTAFDSWVGWFSIAFCVLGMAIRISVIGHAAAHTSGRNTKTQVASSLNTTGMYSLVRHPLYLANFIIALGIILITRHVWAIALYILVFFLYYQRIMFTEEAFLQDKFGDEYLEWAKRTPPFFPYYFRYQPPKYPFRYKVVLRRENDSLFSLVTVLVGLNIARDWIMSGSLRVDFGWIVLIILAFALWIILRIYRKVEQKAKGA